MNLPPELTDAMSRGDLVIFAGAGFSVESGCLGWRDSLIELANEIQEADPTYAQVIRAGAEKERFLEAAESFYLADITADRRHEVLRKVFDRPIKVSARQVRLARTPCQAIVTTNYDRSLDLAGRDAKVDFISYTESESDLAHARVCAKPFVLRLHGRIENPDSLVLARRHYAELSKRTAYVEFIREMVLNRNVIFFGFSFADPFITTTILEIARSVHSVFRRKAYALLPGAPPPQLAAILSEASIASLVYDPKDRHKEAWDVFGPRATVEVVSPDAFVIEKVRSELAAVYARAKAGSRRAERTEVLSGLLVPILAEAGAGATISRDVFETRARELLALPAQIDSQLVLDAARSLERDGLVRLGSEGLTILKLPDMGALGKDLDKLARGVTARSEVRYVTPVADAHHPAIRELLVAVLAADGLHVAHSFIRALPLNDARIVQSVEAASKVVHLPAGIRGGVLQALHHLLSNPDREEEALLASLSALAFSTSLMLTDPILAAGAPDTVARGAFFDANVVLPWLCKGHPLQPLYDSIAKVFAPSSVYVIPEYLNELVSHRKLAIKEFNDAKLGDEGRLQRFVSLFGGHGVNTFVGGYAGSTAAGAKATFEEYLEQVAPFETEQEAGAFLEKMGVRIYSDGSSPSRVDGGPVFGALKAALRDRDKVRADILIGHDARQLEVLKGFTPRSECPYLVTADKILILAASETTAKDLLGRVLLPHQAAYLVELAGKGSGLGGVSRAIWMSPPDFHRRVNEYYIDRVLREYEYAQIEDLPTIVDAVMNAMEREPTAEDGDGAEESEGARAAAFNSLDRFEPRFYETMLAAKRAKGLAPSAPEGTPNKSAPPNDRRTRRK